MQQLQSSKHRGWKEIAAALQEGRTRCSVRKAQELARPSPDGLTPLPVEEDHLGLFVEASALAEWIVVRRRELTARRERAALLALSDARAA